MVELALTNVVNGAQPLFISFIKVEAMTRFNCFSLTSLDSSLQVFLFSLLTAFAGWGLLPTVHADHVARISQDSEKAVQDWAAEKVSSKTETAVFAAGCFWCVEAVYLRLEGVESVESGYTGGSVPNPNYQMVMTGQTGHAEAIRIVYKPDVISYQDLLEVLFEVHDPTTLNRQGNDVGTQYRSAIFYADTDQRDQAIEYIKQMTESKKFKRPIVTQLVAASEFYVAEAYHQNYYKKNPGNPYCQATIPSKLRKLKAKFKDKLKEN